jgi:hypothetical protein
LAVIALTIALGAVVSFYWAAVGAALIGIVIGWIASNSRFMRRAITAIVDWVASVVAAFS